MACDHVKLGNVGAIVCSGRGSRGRKCFACHLAGGFQCDWILGADTPNGEGRILRCDRFICVDHAQVVAPEKHLCPEHQAAYTAWLAERPKATPG